MTKHEMETVVVRTQQIKSNHTLPDEVVEALKSLPTLEERIAYAEALVNKGWTLQSIANVMGRTRERVRQYVNKNITDEVREKIKNLPLPEIPTKDIYATRRKKVAIDPDVLAQLKELHSKAFFVRGRGSNNRKEAELFTKLAWEETQRGVTTYAIAKALGLTNGALHFRFVRYGYKKSNGKSSSYRQLTHRVKEGE